MGIAVGIFLTAWRVSGRIGEMDSKAEKRTGDLRKEVGDLGKELVGYMHPMEGRASNRMDRMEADIRTIRDAVVPKA